MYNVETMISAGGRNFYVYKDKIQARNAFNGIHLWTRPFRIHTHQERGPDGKAVIRSHRVLPAASRDSVFAASGGKLIAYDAATGLTGPPIDNLRDPREILVEGATLLAADGDSVRAWEAAARKPLWSSKIQARRMIASDGAVFCLSGSGVICLDLTSGQERWRIQDEDAGKALACAYHGGVLALEKGSLKDDPAGSGLMVYSARDGRRLWSREYDPAMGHVKTARAIFSRGLLWIHAFEGKRATVIGLDPATGQERKRWDCGREGGRCAPPMASERFW